MSSAGKDFTQHVFNFVSKEPHK